MSFATVNSKHVACHVIGSGDATPLLLINGGPGFPHGILHLSPAWELLAQKRRVIFFDQPGTGQSWPLDTADTLTVGDALASIDAVRAAVGVSRIVVLGHSWGGYVALAYGIRHPDNVEAVVLVGSVAPKLSATEFLFGALFPERISAEKNLNPAVPSDVEKWEIGRLPIN